MPSLTVLGLIGQTYEEHTMVEGTTPYVTEEPFPVRVVPAELMS